MLLKAMDGELERDPIRSALASAGIRKLDPKAKISKEELREILNARGASLEDAADALATELLSEDKRLNAAKLTFELHGAIKEIEAPSVPSITVNIIGQSANNVNLLEILSPREI